MLLPSCSTTITATAAAAAAAATSTTTSTTTTNNNNYNNIICSRNINFVISKYVGNEVPQVKIINNNINNLYKLKMTNTRWD